MATTHPKVIKKKTGWEMYSNFHLSHLTKIIILSHLAHLFISEEWTWLDPSSHEGSSRTDASVLPVLKNSHSKDIVRSSPWRTLYP